MFALSEFLVEQIIRDGIEDLKVEIDLKLDDIYGTLKKNLLKDKYGQNEIDNIKSLIEHSQIHITQSFPTSSSTELPSFSIHLEGSMEDESLAALNDGGQISGLDSVEQIEIEPEVIVEEFTSNSYNSNTGFVFVPDSVDLSNVRFNHYYLDIDDNEYQIKTPINNDTGNKKFTLDKNLNINLTGKIVSAINTRIFSVNRIYDEENILIGVHTQNSTLTKLFYYMLKYILYKAKPKLLSNELELAKYSGSDFKIDQSLLPDHVFSRFITLNFKAVNSWKQEELNQTDYIESQTNI